MVECHVDVSAVVSRRFPEAGPSSRKGRTWCFRRGNSGVSLRVGFMGCSFVTGHGPWLCSGGAVVEEFEQVVEAGHQLPRPNAFWSPRNRTWLPCRVLICRKTGSTMALRLA